MTPLLFLAAIASTVPNLDVAKLCRGEASVQQSADYDGCVKEQQAAEQELQSKWSQYPAKARDGCARAIRAAPGGSYVELETCIEIQTDTGAPK
ncbi:MAG TPA: hypothetical protein VKS78_10740 [Roseiarcus sp.]|nr:hypothetical protein [Roseiarcus sp.]